MSRRLSCEKVTEIAATRQTLRVRFTRPSLTPVAQPDETCQFNETRIIAQRVEARFDEPQHLEIAIAVSRFETLEGFVRIAQPDVNKRDVVRRDVAHAREQHIEDFWSDANRLAVSHERRFAHVQAKRAELISGDGF